MPTYEYACTACGQHLEVVQSMSDEPLRVCGACGGNLRKVFSPIGIVFKGSGFYRTDSRSSDGKRGRKPAPATAEGKARDGRGAASSPAASSAAGSTEKSA
jgi:putative FmdB family regulatory protein